MQILLVEDDAITRDLLRRMIEREARDGVTFAEDGEAAWQVLAQADKSFDACVLDMCMPRLGGLDLLARMRGSERLRRIQVVFCTAIHDRATVRRAGELGVSHYLVKPVSRAALLERLRQVRASLDNECVLEAEPVVCRRLGIDEVIYRVMLQAVISDASAWCADLRSSANPDEARKLFVRGRGIKGSCLNLGAIRTAERLAAIEEAIQASLAAPDGAEAAFPGPKILGLSVEFERHIQLISEKSRAAA